MGNRQLAIGNEQKEIGNGQLAMGDGVRDDVVGDVESVIKKIEERKVDVTGRYGEWRNIGFALASEFGAAGRDYFHRVSCFYPKYTKAECDQQYSSCLKGKKHGVTLRSFFYYAKQAGVGIGNGQLAMGKEQGETDNRQLAMGNRQFVTDNGQLAKGNSIVVCEDKDFGIVLDMVRVLVKHASKVYSELPEEEQLPQRKNRQERFYEALPKAFNRKVYLEVARSQSIPDKTAQRYIAGLCKSGVLHHDGPDQYENVFFEDVRK